MSLLHYLAYGSNLPPRRLSLRVPSARVAGTTVLEGFELRFHKAGQDGSAKCDAHETGDPAHRLHAAVYTMAAAERVLLDRVEGLGRGYDLRELTIDLGGQAVTAFMYCAAPPYVDADLLPFDWYKALVSHGARAHAFPEHYVAAIDDHPARRDPDSARAAEHFAIIGP